MAKSRKRTESPASVQDPANPQSAGANGADHYDRVAQRAYELYLARGGSHGSDWDDWLAAERELMNPRAVEKGKPQGKRDQRG